MIKQLIEQRLKKAIGELGLKVDDIVLSIPGNSHFGDYSTNVALQLSKQKTQNCYHSIIKSDREKTSPPVGSPVIMAEELIKQFGHPHYLERIEVAGPGFINFFISNEALLEALGKPLLRKLNQEGSKRLLAKRVLIEYAQPNTHKEFHIGHLRNITIGESLARLLEFEGVEVYRINYGSDIGLPVAKALWGVKYLPEQFAAVKKESLKQRARFLGQAYALANSKYESDPAVKLEIDELNKAIYRRDPVILPLWQETREWSYAYFDTIYSRLNTEFDRIISESEVEATGREIVEENIGKVFIKDNGAVIFPGEKYGLHNRVFITSQGHPTYEAKELGVTRREQEIFPYDEALHVVDNQQTDYFQVVTKAIELMDPKMLGRKRHVSYGFVTLTTGKMSSRQGNIVAADDLLEQVKQEIKQEFPNNTLLSDNQVVEKIAVAAIKYSMLKYALNTDIVFDIKQSVSLQGDSGPYLLYAYARTESLLRMAKEARFKFDPAKQTVNPEERELLRLLEFFYFYSRQSAQTLAPNTLSDYLTDLAKSFNLFYQRYPIIKSKDQEFRLSLTRRVGEVMDLGLSLLGIKSLPRM